MNTAATTPRHGPSERLLRNIASSWGQMALGAIVAFFVSPFLVHTLGTEQYGVWALVFSIIGYMALLDVGMKQSLARFLSKHYATADWQGLNETVSTSTAIYGVTGALVVVATLAIAWSFLGAFKIAPELVPTMRAALILIGINQAVTFLFMTGTSIGPFHRYDISNLIDMAFGLVTGAATVVILKLGYGLVVLAWTVLIINIVRSIVRRIVQQRLVPEMRLSREHVKRERVRELLGYGFISFFIVVSWLVVFNVQNILIGLLIGGSAVAYYNIAGQVINYLRSMANAISIPLVPAVSHFDTMGERQRIADLHLRTTGYLYYAMAAVCVGILCFGRDFIFLWMGPDFKVTVTILTILAVPACLSLPQTVANSVLLGVSRHAALFRVLLVEAAANLGLSIVLVKAIGLVGVAWGTAIPQLVIYTVVYPRIFQRIIGDDLKHFYVTCGRMAGKGILFALPPALILSRLHPIAGWPGFWLSAVIVVGVSAVGFWLSALSAEDRRNLLGKLHRRRSAAPVWRTGTRG